MANDFPPLAPLSVAERAGGEVVLANANEQTKNPAGTDS